MASLLSSLIAVMCFSTHFLCFLPTVSRIATFLMYGNDNQFITPILKKEKAAEPTNYRIISLTAIKCKLMEVIIKDQIIWYLVDKGLTNKRQHASISKHSMATNLLEFINDWLVSFKSCSRTDVIYFEFSKAFDTAVISKLLFKLECTGITGLLVSWIRLFLSIGCSVKFSIIIFHRLLRCY